MGTNHLYLNANLSFFRAGPFVFLTRGARVLFIAYLSLQDTTLTSGLNSEVQFAEYSRQCR